MQTARAACHSLRRLLPLSSVLRSSGPDSPSGRLPHAAVLRAHPVPRDCAELSPGGRSRPQIRAAQGSAMESLAEERFPNSACSLWQL